MKKIIIGLIFVLILLSGCSAIKEGIGELGSCLESCNKLCSLADENNLSLDGFDQLRLAKQEGRTTISCTCQCN